MPQTHDTVLFMYPAACSRVTMCALEEAGITYDAQLVNIGKMKNKEPAYLALNPKGKVPALRIGGRVMTENTAILWFLHEENPQAGLLPHSDDAAETNGYLADVAWCGGTLHPIVRQIRAPAKYTTMDPAGVAADGTLKFAHECEVFEARLSGGRWWYGASWSIVDVYLYWCYNTVEKSGFPVSNYPALADHAARVRARPCFQRALAKEQAILTEARAELPEMHL